MNTRHKSLLFAAVGLSLALGSRAAAGDPPSPCDKLFREGDFTPAAGCFAVTARQNPADPTPLFRCGLCLFRLGRYPEAVTWIQRALDLDPSDLEARELLGRARVEIAENQSRLDQGVLDFRAGLYGSALVEFQWAALEDPRSVSAHFNLAVTFYKLGQISDAQREIRQTLSLNPTHPGALYLQGVLYQMDGEQQKALTAFEALTSTQNGDFYNVRARERIRMGRNGGRAAFHGSLRSFVGMNRSWPVPEGSKHGLGDLNRDVSLQGGWGPWGRLKGVFFGSTGMSLVGRGVGISRVTWANLGASCNPDLSDHLSLIGEATGLLAFTGQAIQYSNQQVSGGAQIRRMGLEFWQVQAQALREIFPPNHGMDSLSGVFNFLGRQPAGGPFSVQVSGSLRTNTARDPLYRYRSGLLGLSLQRGFLEGWAGEMGVRVQGLIYPSNWTLAPGGRRSDLIKETYLEITLQVLKPLFATLGDLVTFQDSNIAGYSNKTNKVYSGIQCYL